MNKDNNFGRLLLLLLLAFGICLGLYYLPDQLFGMKIKKVDLLSDLRIKPESLSMDSLRMQLEQPDTVRIDSAAVRDSILKTNIISQSFPKKFVFLSPYKKHSVIFLKKPIFDF